MLWGDPALRNHTDGETEALDHPKTLNNEVRFGGGGEAGIMPPAVLNGLGNARVSGSPGRGRAGVRSGRFPPEPHATHPFLPPSSAMSCLQPDIGEGGSVRSVEISRCSRDVPCSHPPSPRSPGTRLSSGAAG